MKRIILLFAIVSFFASCDTFKKSQQTVPMVRKDVDAVEGTLSLHPLRVVVPTKETEYKCILDARGKTIYITDDTETYDEIGKYLPLQINPENVVLLQGTFIDPFVLFTKEEFDDMNSKFAKLGVQLNGYKIARLMNAGLTTWTDLAKMGKAPQQKVSSGYKKPGT